MTIAPERPAALLPAFRRRHRVATPDSTTLAAAVARVAALRATYADRGHAVVLVAGSISNGAQIAHVHGTGALAELTDVVAARVIDASPLVTSLIGTSPVGGFLVATVVDRELAHTQVGRLLADARGLVQVGGEEVWPVVTSGVRECELDLHPREALRDVMAAVMTASRETPGGTHWFDGGSTTSPQEDLRLVRDLSLALDHGPEQLQLAFQPVVDLRDHTVVGAEALLRWHHPERGSISPLVAVESAERTGLIVPLGQHVLDVALEQAAAWRHQVGLTFRMHVNVSPLELRDPLYVDRVEAALHRTDVTPASLLLEITETALLADQGVVRTLHALRDLGVGTGIDDFGTGYSSLAHLQRLPIDTVKIDRSLVTGIARGSADLDLARAVIGLVSHLGVSLIAEGIESATDAVHLRSLGCTLGQGYHLGRPVPADQMLAPADAGSLSA